MNNGIDIKYIAAAMSEILKMDVPCNEIYFTPLKITREPEPEIWFKSEYSCYSYLGHYISAYKVEKLAEKIRDKEEKNMEERLNRVELKNGCISMIYEHNDDFDVITEQMHDIYIKKNHDYGNSFDKSIDELGIVAAVTRMSDKMERLKSLVKKESEVKDESFTDTVLDLANYAVMTAVYLKKH